MNILVDGQTLQSPEINRGIGIYFKNVLNNMVKQSFIHNWYIAVGNRSHLSALDPWVAERLMPIENEIFSPGSDYSRTAAYTEALEKIVAEKNIDVFWCPNPLMLNVLFIDRPLNCAMFAMLHDIIPVILPVAEWSGADRREYNRRLGFLKKGPVSLLCNSNATKKDFEEYICRGSAMYVTPLAADSRKFYRYRREEEPRESTTIVFTGGFDYRKNMDGAVKAFAAACRKYCGNRLIDRAKFKLVCSAPREQQEAFYRMAEELGIRDRVMLTGFLSDQELSDLYYHCDLFFFPSLYEGFGLPIVEAMLAGAFVLSADNSSLPEVCGEHAILCDANNIDSMADKIMEALATSERETAADKRKRQEYALSFSWEKTAAGTLEACESVMGRKGLVRQDGLPKKKLAVITPWPAQESGIANYIYKLTPYLAEYFDIDIFVDNSVLAHMQFLKNEHGGLYMLNELDRLHGKYDHLLYQMGNSAEYHSGIYQYLKKYPGITEIHDYILHPFFYHAYFLKSKKDIYRTALLQGYGADGLEHFEAVREKRAAPDNERFPMSHSIAAVSHTVLFHNHWSKAQMQGENIYVIPHACFNKENMTEGERACLTETVRSKYKLQESEILISCFGFVNKNKRPEVNLLAVKQLLDKGYQIKLVFWGKAGIEGLEEMAAHMGIKDAVCITGYLEKPTYEIGLALSDIVINLRYPSMGEASGTLCEAFKYGKPVLVSGLNQYQEFPDEVCWKVPVGDGEVACLVKMVSYLIDHPDVRRALGENARAYAEKVLSPAEIAKQYYEILEQVK